MNDDDNEEDDDNEGDDGNEGDSLHLYSSSQFM